MKTPPIAGLCNHLQEFSANRELRGGGRSRDRTYLQHPNSLICGYLQGIFAVGREFGFEPYQNRLPYQVVVTEIPYATEQGIFRSGSGILEARAAKKRKMLLPRNLRVAQLFKPHAARSAISMIDGRSCGLLANVGGRALQRSAGRPNLKIGRPTDT